MNHPPDMPDSPDNSTPAEDRNQKKTSPGRRKGGIIIIILFFIGMVILSRQEPVETIDCTPEIMATKPDVIMLGAWWCSYCYQAKKYFQQNNIHYCEYDMESTDIGKRLYQEHGGGAVPILLIGQYKLSGFNEHQIESALDLANKNPVATE